MQTGISSAQDGSQWDVKTEANEIPEPAGLVYHFSVCMPVCVYMCIDRTSVLLEAGLILPGQGFFLEELKPITFHFSGDWDVNQVHDFALKMLKWFAD